MPGPARPERPLAGGARDDPSFEVYRRLDVFYLENWSIILDLAILLITAQRVAARAFRLLGRRTLRLATADQRRSCEAEGVAGC